MIDESTDPVLRRLNGLETLTPDPRRAALVRARCRARLAPPEPTKQGYFAPVLLAGFCVVYLSALIHDVLRLRGH